MPTHRRLHGFVSMLVACLVIALALAMTAAASSSGRSGQAPQTITVLTDNVRAPYFEAYGKAHHVKVKVEIGTDVTILTQLRLALKAGSGIPDVVWGNAPPTAVPFELSQFAGPLDKYIPPATQKRFVKGANDACMVSGHLYCIRNDLSQDVLWVNTSLFKQFGYKIPNTWQDFTKVGLALAKDHPGYSLGGFSELVGVMDEYWGAFQCPFNQLVGPNTVRINMHAAGCQRMYSTLDPLFAARVLDPKTTVLGSDAAALGSSGKLLMQIGPAWWGDFVLKPFYKVPSGQWTATLPPAWGSSPRVTAAAYGGGGLYLVYKKSPVFGAAAKMILAIAADLKDAPNRPTYPAWGPAVPIWTKHVASDPFWSRSPVPALNAAALLVTDTWNYVGYDYSDTYNNVIVPGLAKGKSLASLAGAMQASLVHLARRAGYKVVTR